MLSVEKATSVMVASLSSCSLGHDFPSTYLLPSGIEQHEVLLFMSIQEGILQSRH